MELTDYMHDNPFRSTSTYTVKVDYTTNTSTLGDTLRYYLDDNAIKKLFLGKWWFLKQSNGDVYGIKCETRPENWKLDCTPDTPSNANTRLFVYCDEKVHYFNYLTSINKDQLAFPPKEYLHLGVNEVELTENDYILYD